MDKVCLVVIFNHRWDTNISKIKSIYKDRFDNIKILMPFYDGNEGDVIPVYESSFQFQGFLIQAYEQLASTGADYYFFVSDDMVISPEINQENVLSILKMNNKDVFFPGISPLNSLNGFSWSHSRYSSRPFFHKSTQWQNSLPDKEKALKLFEAFFAEKYPDEYEDIFFGDADKENVEEFVARNGGTRTIPYPLARGYSDIFMISRRKLLSVSRTCGVFSAMNLFVEIAIPTSFVLNVDKENTVDLEEIGYIGKTFWGSEEINAFETRCQNSLKKLYDEWDEDALFYHPVKFSRWKLDCVG